MLSQASQLGWLARLHGLDCYVDWRGSFYSEPDDPTNLFGTAIFHERLKCITTLEDYDRVLSQCLVYESGAELEALFQCDSKIPSEPVLITSPATALKSPSHFPFLRDFYFSPPVETCALNFLESQRNHFLVGVHYRHGNGEFAELKSDEVVKAEIVHIERLFSEIRNDHTDAVAVVCTDSTTSQEIFSDVFRPCEIRFTTDSLPDAGTGPLHYAHLLREPPASPPQTTLFDALVDMTILSKCEMLLRAKFGSFPDWATGVIRLRDRHREKTVITYPYFRRQFRNYRRAHTHHLEAQERLQVAQLQSVSLGTSGQGTLNSRKG